MEKCHRKRKMINSLKKKNVRVNEENPKEKTEWRCDMKTKRGNKIETKWKKKEVVQEMKMN